MATVAANQVAITTFPRVELNPHHLQMENAFVKMEIVFAYRFGSPKSAQKSTQKSTQKNFTYSKKDSKK